MLPNTKETLSWGSPHFRVGEKIFCGIGGEKGVLAIGLVAELVPAAETIARALELAAHIAEKPPLALRLAKATVRAAYELPLTEGLALERRA